MIAVVDYGAGNLRSVYNTLTYLGADVITIDSPAALKDAEKIVLPGVGAFGAGMNALRESGFEKPILDVVDAGTPLIGICLGMQYLFDVSYEMGEHQGLGLLPGQVVKFPHDGPLVPHIGWNQLQIEQPNNPLLVNVPDCSYAYFVHSYYVEASNHEDVIATTNYGLDYASVVARDNVFGIQCHPEKSQHVGQIILKNFVEM